MRDFVMHMSVKSDNLMVGTEHEGEAKWKHDAMVLLTAKETIKWTRTAMLAGQSLLSCWVLPEAGLNDFIAAHGKTTTRYGRRPPGSLPRLMSLDEFGNKVLMDSVNDHISATKKMMRGPDVNTDPKFEFCDQVRASRALLRVWDPANGPNGGSPTSAEIVAGWERVWGKHLGEIRMATGRMVGSRIGNRKAEENKPRGGKRERGESPWAKWLHPDARLAQAAKIERCTDMAARVSGQST